MGVKVTLLVFLGVVGLALLAGSLTWFLSTHPSEGPGLPSFMAGVRAVIALILFLSIPVFITFVINLIVRTLRAGTK